MRQVGDGKKQFALFFLGRGRGELQGFHFRAHLFRFGFEGGAVLLFRPEGADFFAQLFAPGLQMLPAGLVGAAFEVGGEHFVDEGFQARAALGKQGFDGFRGLPEAADIQHGQVSVARRPSHAKRRNLFAG